MYCAGVLTFDGGFMESSSGRNGVYHRKNQPAAGALPVIPTCDLYLEIGIARVESMPDTV